MIRKLFLPIFIIFCTKSCFAVDDPVLLLKKVTDDVMIELKSNRDILLDRGKTLHKMIDHLIVPHVDFKEMSLWVAGKKAWRESSKDIQNRFISEFKILVVNTYATALANYTNEIMEFSPQKYNTAKTRIQISSKIVRQHKDDINLVYRLIKHQDSWKVYDVIIEGISILQGFQAQFSNDIKRNGLDNVTNRIRFHNNKETGKI